MARWVVLGLSALCSGLLGTTAVGEARSQAATNAEPVAPPLVAAEPQPLAQVDSDAPLRRQLEALRAAASARQAPRSPPRVNAPSPREAAWVLGLLALHGIGQPNDAPQAQHWFERAQALGHPWASAGLAWCALQGCSNGQTDPALARQWLQSLRRVAPGRALYLEWRIDQQLAPLQGPPSTDLPGPTRPLPGASERNTLLRAAAQTGDAQALNELGLELLAAGRMQEALVQFNAAGSRSDAARNNAQLLGRRLHSSAIGGAGPARSTARDWFLQAQRYHRGDGIPANYSEALRLYQIAANAGDAPARRMIELIFSRPAPGGQLDVGWMQQLAMTELSATGATVRPQPLATWQRDPSPLWDLVPPEWRAAALRTAPGPVR